MQLISSMEGSAEKIPCFSHLVPWPLMHAQPDVEFIIATFLVQQISSVNDDVSDVVHLLLAMGNITLALIPNQVWSSLLQHSFMVN